MRNSCPQGDSNPGPSAYKANSLSFALLVEISIEHLNVDRVLPECAIKINLHSVHSVPHCRCSKMFVVYYIVLTLYSQQTSKSNSKTIQILYDKNTR